MNLNVIVSIFIYKPILLQKEHKVLEHLLTYLECLNISLILFFNLLVLNISLVLFDDIMLKICSLVKLMDSERH